jgi:hypothetical protein
MLLAWLIKFRPSYVHSKLLWSNSQEWFTGRGDWGIYFGIVMAYRDMTLCKLHKHGILRCNAYCILSDIPFAQIHRNCLINISDLSTAGVRIGVRDSAARAAAKHLAVKQNLNCKFRI